MSINSEFYTVDLIVNSDAETLGGDAFALAVIKTERQLRKFFTFLVFQFPCFTVTDIPKIRVVLSNEKQVYFDGLEKGIESFFLP